MVWGKEHREFFLRLLAPSLIAPGNIPSLENREGARFLLCTTDVDWNAMQDDPDFVALAREITVVKIGIPDPRTTNNKYLTMSEGHKRATHMAFEAGANAMYMTPDSVYSDGAVQVLQRHAQAGRQLVFGVAVRYTLEGAVNEISSTRKGPGEPLSLGTRFLADVALRHMHDETLRFDWDATYFAPMPVCPFWHVGTEGVLYQGLSWAPLMVAYSSLHSHDTATFDRWTMDGDYIHRNFGAEPDMHVLRDSDELMLVTFTPKADRPGHIEDDALAPRWYNSWPVIGHYWKIGRVRWMLESGGTDPLKHKLFRLSVCLHRGDISEEVWQTTERRAGRIVSAALRPSGLIEQVICALVRRIESMTIWPFQLLHRPGVRPPAAAVNRILVNQSGPGTHRVVRIGPPLLKGKWYWEVFSPNLGVAGQTVSETGVVGIVGNNHSMTHAIGTCGPGWGWRGDGSLLQGGGGGGPVPDGGASNSPDETLMIAYDADAGNLWFGRNGIWFGGSDPAIAHEPKVRGIRGVVHPAMSSMHGGAGTAQLESRVSEATLKFPAPSGFNILENA